MTDLHTAPDLLRALETLIAQRRQAAPPGSYTADLFAQGRARIAQKVGEEAVETVVAALAQPRAAQVGEIADLLFHLLVLMNDLGLTLDDVEAELRRRHTPSAS